MGEDIRRVWVNQPSTLQPMHRWNGMNMLATSYNDYCDVVYFLEGDSISMVMPKACLSDGWLKKEVATHHPKPRQNKGYIDV